MAVDTQQRKRSGAWIAIWVTVAIVVGLAAFVGAARATDASSFCQTCHEMQPYYDAWSKGSHGEEGVDCVECHVDTGFVPRLAHKFVALGEVWNHFLGNTSFPLETPPDVPKDRCERCHPKVVVNRKNFSHELHASKGACQDCHPRTGHNVTSEALTAAGILNPNVTSPRLTRPLAVVNGGRANVPGHVKVVCSQCHDMQATGCRACHKPPHKERGDCAQCHKTGREFAFSHPGAQADCTTCHKAPKNHPAQAAGKACSACHTAGGSWRFKHPGLAAQCTECHTMPAGHLASSTSQPCSECHRQPGVSWSFAHPSVEEHNWRKIACVKCHPRSYSSAYCTCHGGRPPSD